MNPEPPVLLPQERAYRARLLTPVTAQESGPLRYLDDALLVVGADGRIASVEPFTAGAFPGPVLDLHPAVLLPGFVDAHLHYPQLRITGSASGPLLEWLERTVFPEEARFTDPAHAVAVAGELTARLLSSGTTTCAVYASSSAAATDTLFDAFCRAGLRVTAGLTLMDQRCPDAVRVDRETAIPAARDLVQRWHGAAGGRLQVAITPRFALACSRPLLEAAARLAADHDLLIQTHVSENHVEGEETLREHPYAIDYLDVYDKVGLLTDRTLLAHAVHLSAREWDRVAERGAKIVHCPDSNFFLGSGRMRVREAAERRIRVGLGSDVGAGRSLDMRRSMSSAFDNALCLGERLGPAEIFAMATLGGAEALGIGAVTGSLEAGKEADFIVVHLPAHAGGGEAEILGQVVFAGDGGAVRRVFVRGVQIA